MTTPAVDSTETLYRQVPPGGNPIYFDPNGGPLARTLFLPSRADRDGLSLIRSRFRSRVWAAYRPQRPTTQYRLASVVAATLADCALEADLGDLHVDPSPDALDERFGEPWAHCVVREVNRPDYEDNADRKAQIKEWALAVAKTIPPDQVSPAYGVPSNDDPYRPQ